MDQGSDIEIVPQDPDSDDASAATATAASTRPTRLVLHRQAALTSDTSSILDISKKGKGKLRGNVVDQLGREDNLSPEAKNVLRSAAEGFLEGCFNRMPSLHS